MVDATIHHHYYGQEREPANESEDDYVGGPPYKGLLAYGEEDADLFFGREGLTVEILERSM